MGRCGKCHGSGWVSRGPYRKGRPCTPKCVSVAKARQRALLARNNATLPNYRDPSHPNYRNPDV